MGILLEILKKIQTILVILFEHRELFIIVLTIITIIITIISNQISRKTNYISNVNNNTDD